MFLAFWYYLHGYVMIEVSGFSVERFVNMAAFRGVYLWDICPKGTVVSMKVSRTGCGELDECARKTGCRFEVIEERGLPSCIKQYQKRKILAAGVLFFAVGLYALSSFIWVVRVEGNERISQEDILSACEEMGLKPGALKFHLDMEEITDALAENFMDISWVSVNIQGTKATIKLVETIPQPQLVDKETPSDVIANEDGVILDMAVEAGTPKVVIGDVAEKGDILISGEVVLKDGDEEVGREYVRARGAIHAKLWKQMKQELPFQYTQREYTGEMKENHSLFIKDSVIDMIKPKLTDGFYEAETIYVKNLGIGDFQFPLALEKQQYRQYQEIEKTRTAEQAKEECKKILEEKAKEFADKEREILDISIDYQVFDDHVEALATIAISQRIDTEQKMNYGSDTEDGTSGENITN